MNMRHSFLRIICLLMALLIISGILPVSAGAEADARALAVSLTAAEAEDQSDPWVLAILQSGPKDALLSGGTLSFSLRSFTPDLKELGSYASAPDPAAWRQSLLADLSAWNLKVSVPCSGDGTPGKKAGSRLLKAVKSAAKEAKTAFGKKDVILALRDLFWCSPTDAKKVSGSSLLSVRDAFSAFILSHAELFPCESPAFWAPAFYLLQNWSLSTGKGPHALAFSWQGSSCEALVSLAFDDVSLAIACVPASERPNPENIPFLWRSSLAASSVSLAGRKGETRTTVFDLDDLIAGKLPADYLAFYRLYQPDEALNRLTAACPLLPDAACGEFPKTGVNTSAKQGRSVTVSVGKTGRNTYVRFCSADTGVLLADAFIRPDSSVTLRVPEGTCIVRFASGAAWYGLPTLFGSLGDYTESDPVTVGKAKLKLTAGVESEGFRLHEISAENFAGE